MSRKRIKVTLGDVVGIAEVFEDKAPKTAKAVWDALPIDGVVNHANFSGEEVTFPCYPVTWERENELYDTKPGDLGYFVTGPAICIYYGVMKTISPGSVFGRITENLEAVQKVARSAWKTSGIPVRLEKLEG